MSFDRKTNDNKRHRMNEERETKVEKSVKARRRNVRQELDAIDLDMLDEEDWLLEELYK